MSAGEKIPQRIWQLVGLVLCVPSGGALLGKVYGLAPMHWSVPLLAVPGMVIVAGMYLAARRGAAERATTLYLGFWGGLVGTLGYDLVRVPMHLMGRRVFSPIASYGVWILDASSSSRDTDLTGWTYHFSNGITFGVMYAVVARRWRWGWAVAWAMLLETIAVVSPFGRIFSVVNDPTALAIAYGAHVAYGVPLGLMVARWQPWPAGSSMANRWQALCGISLIAMILMLAIPFFSPATAARDAVTVADGFTVFDRGFTPDWLRVERGATIRLINASDHDVVVRWKDLDQRVPLAAHTTRSQSFDRPGIYQVFLEQAGRTRSSFLIVEPVEDLSSAKGVSPYSSPSQ